MTKPHQDAEPFFITEEVAAEMIAGGYEFESPPKSVNADGASRVQSHDLHMAFFVVLSLDAISSYCH